MDLPTCPSCGQSVLDDDATDCPFCGASMSGKPGAAPKPAPTKPSKPEKKSAKPKPSAPAEDAPIAADDAATAKAIPVRRKKVKGLVLRVKCPMCEAEGWVPAKAAGREVKCANKECLVPLFTAPELPKKVDDEPESKPSGMSWPVLAFAGVAAVAVAVVWIVWGTDKPETEIPPDVNSAFAKLRQPPENPDDPGGDPKPDDPVLPRGPTLAEIRESVLTEMVDCALRADNHEKPLTRQRTAVAYARAGEVDTAIAQVGELEKLSRFGSEFDRVDALVEIGFAHLSAGNDAGATKAADDALAAASKSPRSGRSLTRTLANLAALLHDVGRGAEAASLAGKDAVNSDLVKRTTLHLLMAGATGSFDFDEEVENAPFLPPTNVHAQLVTVQLAAHDRWDAARAYASGRTGNDRAECLVRVAELLAARNPADSTARINAIVTDLGDSPAAGIALARAAVRRAKGPKPATARTLIDRAATLLDFAVTKPAELPGAQAVFERTHPFVGRTRPTRAMAVAELARARSTVDDESAWDSYAAAIGHASAFAPSRFDVEAEIAAAERGDEAVVTALVDGLGLADRSDAVKRLTDYIAQLKGIENTSRTVFDTKVAILTDATRRGHGDEVWTLVAETGGPDAYRGTSLHFSLNAALGQREGIEVGENPPGEMALVVPESLLKDDAPNRTEIGKQLGASNDDEADVVLFRLASRLARDEGREKALELVLGIERTRNYLDRAEAAGLVEARTSRGTDLEIAWKRLRATRDYSRLDRAVAAEALLFAFNADSDEPDPETSDDSVAKGD